MYDYLIVGSGLFGATFARQATDAGKKVLVIDKRPNIAGNVYTEDVEGIHVHKYGAHIFHTNDKKVWGDVTRFADHSGWNANRTTIAKEASESGVGTFRGSEKRTITFAPSETFQPSGKRKSTLSFAKKRLVGAGSAVAFVMLTSAIGYVFTIVSPAFSRFLVDRLLTGENREQLMPFIALVAAVSVLQDDDGADRIAKLFVVCIKLYCEFFRSEAVLVIFVFPDLGNGYRRDSWFMGIGDRKSREFSVGLVFNSFRISSFVNNNGLSFSSKGLAKNIAE